jgi:DNA-binding NarL/FixJ family response regulator
LQHARRPNLVLVRTISDRLVVAARTADTHAGNILNKLELHSRAQLAAWAVAQGLEHVPADSNR